MALLTINDNPSITDTIVFTLQTPDADGCLTTNPYKVNKLVIYYVERDFNSGNTNAYQQATYNLDKLKAAEEAEALACATPTDVNIANAKKLRQEADSTATVTPFYFNESRPVHVVGNDAYPAWLSTDLDNAFLELVTEDEDGNPVFGQYTYTWEPKGMREGDYFICWTWTPLPAGDSLSSHMRFTLMGDTQVTTSIPTHFTDPAKYTTLLERYTPEMFKMVIADSDETPFVLDKFNQSVALGFNVLEDLANQIVDLQDANSLHEALIPYLSNLFDLKLKTDDPTRWRGQIKRAIPLYKMKGTKKGLSEALEHAAIKMVSLTQLWEIISSYTWQEVFTYDGGEAIFELEKVALPIDYDNFELWIREADSDTWVALSGDYVEFTTSDGVTTMAWMGSNLSIDPIDLIEGDEIRVLYKYAEVPDLTAQTIENYIRSLPLMDQRDEHDQMYPLKNWNVRVIPENDPMFDLVIPTRHPYHDPLVYGKVRTEFPYSENIYNMEEYNGSIRNSKDPCDIDRNFVDPCTACISSSYNIDLEIENLSNDRILEAQEVLREYTPFHAVLHTFNFLGGISEFVESPVEEVEALVSINGEEFVIAGEAQMWFNRVMKLVETNGILRDELATSEVALATTSGTAYNDAVVVFSPESKLDNIGMALDGSAVLNILAPSPLAGTYVLTEPKGNTAIVTAATEPIDDCNNLFATDSTINTCAFTFNIYNPVVDGASLCTVDKDYLYIFEDSTQDFGTLGVKSTFDVDHGTASGPWTVLIPTYDAVTPYDVYDVLPDGRLILTNHGGTLPTSNASGLSYTLKDESAATILTSTGDLTATARGRVTVSSASLTPISNVVGLENFYFEVGGSEYLIIGFVPGIDDQFYIDGYSGPDLGGSTNLVIHQRVLNGGIGYFTHRGLRLQMAGNLESSLGIQNGANSLVVVDDGVENDKFKENYIVVVDSDSYFIDEIDGSLFTLSGASHYWKTLSAGGTSVNVTIYRYVKNGATVMGQQYDLPEHTFRILDRSGSHIIDRTDQDGIVTGLSLPGEGGNQITEFVQQSEGIAFSIEYADGTTEQGEL